MSDRPGKRVDGKAFADRRAPILSLLDSNVTLYVDHQPESGNPGTFRFPPSRESAGQSE